MRAYKNYVFNKSNCLPITEKLAKGIFSLPLYPSIKTSNVYKITKNLKEILNKI